MSKTSVRHLFWDFLKWSGGLPPESVHEITVYVDYACPQNIEPNKAWGILITWMERQGMSRAEKVKYGLIEVRGDLNLNSSPC